MAALTYPAIDPVAVRIGPFALRWYGIAYLLGFVAAGLIVRWLVRRWELNLSDDDLLTIVLAAVIGVLIGGRLGYVVFYGGDYFWRNPARILAIWDGGMSLHGGLAGILVAGAIVAASMRVPFLTITDLGAVGAPVGLFLGRLANFVNGELWGRTTTVPWGIVFPGAGPLPRHPSQLYEALLEGVGIFVVVLWLAMRRPNPPRGVILGTLLTLYGVFRIFVEFVRQPDVQIGTHGFFAGWLTMGMILSAPLVLAGVALLWWSLKRGLPEVGRPESGAAG